MNRNLNSHVSADRAETERILVGLLSELVSQGAWLNPELRVLCTDNEFSLKCPMTNQVTLLSIPEHCLLPLDQFEMFYANEQVRIANYHPDTTQCRKRLMDLVIELYNVSGKVVQFSANSLELILGKNHPITQHMDAREGPVRQPENDTPYDNLMPDEDTLELDQFFRSRTFSTVFDRLESVIIPIIDLMNHHPRGGWSFEEEDNGVRLCGTCPSGTTLPRTYPSGISSECFLNYGDEKDTADLFRYYHYVPGNIERLFSIPLVLPIADDYFVHINRGYKAWMSTASHLLKKLPPLLKLEDRIVSCNNLSISVDPHQDTSTTGIEFMVKMLGKTAGFRATDEVIQDTQSEFLHQNTRYYHELISLIKAEPVTPLNHTLLDNLNLVAQRQLTLLADCAVNNDLS